jgi:hypothetical protein
MEMKAEDQEEVAKGGTPFSILTAFTTYTSFPLL